MTAGKTQTDLLTWGWGVRSSRWHNVAGIILKLTTFPWWLESWVLPDYIGRERVLKIDGCLKNITSRWKEPSVAWKTDEEMNKAVSIYIYRITFSKVKKMECLSSLLYLTSVFFHYMCKELQIIILYLL